MLTVLVRYTHSKREVLFPAQEVEYVPRGVPDAGLLIKFDYDKGTHLGVTTEGDEDLRDVFVMNDNGATVARYTL